MTDLVVISLEAWDQVWRRNQYLVAGLLRSDPGLRVLFVEPPADPLHAVLASRSMEWSRGLRRAELDGVESDRLWTLQPTKLLPRRVDPRADHRMARAVRRAARMLDFESPILWVNDPNGAAVLDLTRWPSLYDITDDWLEAERTPAEHERLVRDEALLMRRCGEVVVCSPVLARTKGAVRRVTLVPNAVDVEAYRAPRERPVDLPDGPVAVYLGTVHTDRMDIDLCVATAAALRGRGHLVLVGPAPLSTADTRRLADSGVVLLGAKDREEVPAYLQHADVLVVPHVVTPFTESLDPIKLYEYRAVGRPVVSTPVAGFRGSADPKVVVAEGDTFVREVQDRLPAAWRFPEGSDPDVPTWADRALQMAEVLAQIRRPGAGVGAV